MHITPLKVWATFDPTTLRIARTQPGQPSQSKLSSYLTVRADSQSTKLDCLLMPYTCSMKHNIEKLQSKCYYLR